MEVGALQTLVSVCPTTNDCRRRPAICFEGSRNVTQCFPAMSCTTRSAVGMNQVQSMEEKKKSKEDEMNLLLSNPFGIEMGDIWSTRWLALQRILD
mmetsp:Transcript_17086/g.46860  ORF Transcript_17086/g.46860 Transcript_17086/m.46860 type:complete len:96 (-) Transcript_17086:134-421(-)